MISDLTLMRYFLKAFAIVISILFFLYAIVLERQTATMIGTVRFKGSSVLLLVGRVQVIISIALFLLGLFVL